MPAAVDAGEDALRAEVEAGLARVERVLGEELACVDLVLRDAARYLLGAGGKRIRPTLALLTSRFGREPGSEDVVTAGAAVELTHLASLYHDDVMDEADLRRGVPAAHLAWSNSVAILAGDLLFARSSRMFAGLGSRAIELQAVTFERLVVGQARETAGPREGEDRVAHYLDVLAGKTGSLIAAAAQLGAMCAKADDEIIPALAAYGERVGIAFQIADDVLDLSPHATETGKLAGTDLRAGVETLPVLLLEREAATDASAADLLARIRERVAGSAPAPTMAARGRGVAALDAADVAPAAEIDGIVAELRAHPVTETTRAEAARWAEEAAAALEPLPAGPAREALIAFARSSVERDR